MLIKTLIALFLANLKPLYLGEDGAGGAAAGADTSAGADNGGDTGDGIRASLEANWDKSAGADTSDTNQDTTDKGGDRNGVSEAARTLAAQRKAASEGKDTTQAGDKTQGDSAAAAAKRAAELAAMSPEDRAKAEAEDAQKAAAAATEAPQHWPAKDREFFAKQAPEVKTWLLGRHKAMEADYTRRVQDVAHVRRESDEIREIFKPFAQAMAADGLTIPMAVRQLAAAHRQLIEDPAKGMTWLADKYGIDLKKLVEGGAAADPAGESPTVKALREEVAELRKWKEEYTTGQQQQQQHANLSKVEQFADERDAKGNLLRPHFDAAAQHIVALMKSGAAKDLQDAYDQAIYAIPEIRTKVLAAQEAERRAKEDEERKAKANAAKTAGFDVKGEGAASSMAATSNSLRADLEAQWDKHMGRV